MPNAASASHINIGELVKADRIHGRLYHDADQFRREMDDIFHKVWVYLAHDSEIPNNGDYVRRQIGLHSNGSDPPQFGIVWQQQPTGGEIPVRVGKIGIHGEGTTEGICRLVETAQREKAAADIVP